MKKNVGSQSIGAQMITAADGTDFTGSVTVYVTGDNGTQAVGANTAGACTHEGNGYHSYSTAQADTNYDHIAFTFIGSGAITTTVQLYTNFPQTVDNATALSLVPQSGGTTSWNATALAAINAEVDTALTDYDPPTKAELDVLGTAALATEAKQDIIDTNVDDIETAIALIPQSGGTTSWNATALAAINAEADTALTDYDPPTNAEMEARTPTAAQLAYIVANAATGLPVTFTTSGGTTTNAVFALIDGGAAEANADHYNGRLLVFTDGTLKGVVTDITDYDGANNATITAIPFAPTASHNARLI